MLSTIIISGTFSRSRIIQIVQERVHPMMFANERVETPLKETEDLAPRSRETAKSIR